MLTLNGGYWTHIPGKKKEKRIPLLLKAILGVQGNSIREENPFQHIGLE